MFQGTRTEALSDAVFAIAMTILVLDLRPPATGEFAVTLLAEWPSYVAYLVAFVTITLVWVNHHAVLSRVRTVDVATLALNAGVLLGISLIAWPTALISAAFRGGVAGDETAAVIVYAVITLLIAASWGALNWRLSRHVELLSSAAAVPWLRRNSVIALSSIGPALLTIGIAFLSPIGALILLALSIASNIRTSFGPREDAPAAP